MLYIRCLYSQRLVSKCMLWLNFTGMRSGLVVMFATTRMPRSVVQTLDRNLDWDLCSMHTPALPLQPQDRVLETVRSLETHLEMSKWRVNRMGADTSVLKKKHEWNPMAGEEEWMEKHLDTYDIGEKAMDTNMGGSPGYQSQSHDACFDYTWI